MKAKAFCPKHKRILSLDEIIIRNGNPLCNKCLSVLEFTNVKPRKLK